MKNSGINSKVKCYNCENTFDVSKENVQFKQDFECEGERLFITYFDCPICGKRHYVQIDNWETLSILNDVIELMPAVMANSKRSKQTKQMKDKRDKLNKLRNDLTSIRKILMFRFTDKKLVNLKTKETTEEMRFTLI